MSDDDVTTPTGILELLADHVVNEERLADDFDLLPSLHRLGDEQQVREEHAVHVHLGGGILLLAQTQSSSVEAPEVSWSVGPTYPAVFALLHPQRPLLVQLSDLLRRRSPHGSHQVEVVELLQYLNKGGQREKDGWTLNASEEEEEEEDGGFLPSPPPRCCPLLPRTSRCEPTRWPVSVAPDAGASQSPRC